MNIVYVGDNRNRGNYGCRATSTALSQLITEHNKIVGVVSGRYTHFDTGELFFYQYFPKFFYSCFGKFKYWDHLKTGLYLFFRMLMRGRYYFSNCDFVDYDFDKSIDNLIKCLPANYHLAEMDLRQYDFDALVVNGEGSFIYASPPRRECLVESMLMYWALKLGKKVYYLNGMLSDDPYTEHNNKTVEITNEIFKKCCVVQVREYESYKFAQKYFPSVNVVVYPDALFTWYDYINDEVVIKNGRYVMGLSGANDSSFTDYDFTREYVCIAGSSSFGKKSGDRQAIVDAYVNLVDRVKLVIKKDVYLVEGCEGDSFLRDVAVETGAKIIPVDTPILSAGKILSKAKVFITGRYHPAILASLGGTPCVFMTSNSHKTQSLQELLAYSDGHEYDVVPNSDEIDNIVGLAELYIAKGKELRDKIKNRCLELSLKAKEIANLVK